MRVRKICSGESASRCVRASDIHFSSAISGSRLNCWVKRVMPSIIVVWVGFPMAQSVKNLPAAQETPGSSPGSGRSPGEGNGNQSSILA